MAHVRLQVAVHRTSLSPMKRLLTRENLYAVLLCLLVILLIIITADSSPTWIYQGF